MNVDELLHRIHRLREVGVSSTAVNIKATTRKEWCDEAEWFGTEVLPKIASI
jgi:hypothetical protein